MSISSTNNQSNDFKHSNSTSKMSRTKDHPKDLKKHWLVGNRREKEMNVNKIYPSQGQSEIPANSEGALEKINTGKQPTAGETVPEGEEASTSHIYEMAEGDAKRAAEQAKYAQQVSEVKGKGKDRE
jgi:hypothetical protein